MYTKAGNIVAGRALDLAALTRLANNRPVADAPCPLCGPQKNERRKQQKRVLRVWLADDGFATYSCARCGINGYAHAAGPRRYISQADLARRMRQVEAHQLAEATRRRDRARWLWDQAVPAVCSRAETYLARRGITVLPPALRFLPARGEHPAAMLAAFALPSELEPETYRIGTAPSAVHMTQLAPDGTKLAKKMHGVTEDWPIALMPPNDLGGLAIAEGIETALSAHQATGLGAWAAGAAGRLPKLAPIIARLAHVEAVTILAEDDPAGQAGADGLHKGLARLRPDIEVRVTGAI